MLFATTCAGCGVRSETVPCPGCVAALRPAPALPPPPELDGCTAVLAYEGVARSLVAGLKYRNARASLRTLARAMAAAAAPWVDEVEVVTWVPTTRSRRHRRGFDQGELLARAVARHLARPWRPLLRRLDGDAQTGRSGEERRAGPSVVARGPITGRRVLLVDDVVTTGATAGAGARALRAAGADRVWLVAAARTPLRLKHRRPAAEHSQ